MTLVESAAAGVYGPGWLRLWEPGWGVLGGLG